MSLPESLDIVHNSLAGGVNLTGMSSKSYALDFTVLDPIAAKGSWPSSFSYPVFGFVSILT